MSLVGALICLGVANGGELQEWVFGRRSGEALEIWRRFRIDGDELAAFPVRMVGSGAGEVTTHLERVVLV